MLLAPVDSRDQLGALHSPALPPASPLCCGFVSLWLKGHHPLAYCSKAPMRCPGFQGFPAGAAKGVAGGPVVTAPLWICPSTHHPSSLAPGPGSGAVPLLSHLGQPKLVPSTGWARLCHSAPRKNCWLRWLCRRVLILY